MTGTTVSAAGGGDDDDGLRAEKIKINLFFLFIQWFGNTSYRAFLIKTKN